MKTAVKDPAFPFRLIIASRPEPAILHFFSTAAKDYAAEIFLNNKYNPDADIKLYLTSHFSRIRRKHAHLPPSWPGEDAIATLVDNASGQMIYAATIIRFVETPSSPPGAQLDIIMNSGVRSTPSNPLRPLDVLYTRILYSSPDPMLALKWLKAYQHLATGWEGRIVTWIFTLQVCESSRGEAEHLFGSMAALVRIEDNREDYRVKFIFYHKSFQDFLSDASRHREFFIMKEEEVEEWILDRLLTVLERKGPAGSLGSIDHSSFCAEVVILWVFMTGRRDSLTEWYDERLLACDVDWWLSCCTSVKRGALNASRTDIVSLLFVVAHNKCSPFLPCRKECRRRRKPILAAWKAGSFAILLDKFQIERILPNSRVLEAVTNIALGVKNCDCRPVTGSRERIQTDEI